MLWVYFTLDLRSVLGFYVSSSPWWRDRKGVRTESCDRVFEGIAWRWVTSYSYGPWVGGLPHSGGSCDDGIQTETWMFVDPRSRSSESSPVCPQSETSWSSRYSSNHKGTSLSIMKDVILVLCSFGFVSYDISKGRSRRVQVFIGTRTRTHCLCDSSTSSTWKVGDPRTDVTVWEFVQVSVHKGVDPGNRSKNPNSSMELWWFTLWILKRGFLRGIELVRL